MNTRLQIAAMLAQGLLASGHYTIPAEGMNPADFEREEVHDAKGNIIGTQPTVIATALILADKLIKQS